MNRYVAAILFLSVMVVVTDARGAFLRATDKFATGDGTGTVGANLNGTAVEDGDVSWIAESTIKFQSGDFIQRVGSAGNNVAIVPVTPGGNARYTVSARILPADSTFPTFFTGLGFTDNVDLEPFWAPGGGGSLWMWLSPQGGYEILAKDTAIHILSNTGPNAAPGFVPGGFNELKLTYDPATNVVNALLAEQLPVLDDPHIPALLGDEQSPVGCEFHRGRRCQPRRYARIDEPGGDTGEHHTPLQGFQSKFTT